MKVNTSQRLRQIMEQRGLRQVDIIELSKPYQEKTGVRLGKSALSQYISGKSVPDQNKLYLLSNSLGVNEAWLMGYDVPQYPQPTSDRIRPIFDRLDEIRQDKVVSYAKEQLEDQNRLTDNIVQLFDYDYYDQPASAGTGQYLNDVRVENISLPVDVNADFVIPIYGDSMEPEFYSGDYVFIKLTVGLSDGDIGVFEYCGDAYIKQLILEENSAYLHSLNQCGDYPDIQIDSNSDFRIIGKVIDVYREPK